MDFASIAQHGATGLAVLLGLIVYELVKQRLPGQQSAAAAQSKAAESWSQLGRSLDLHREAMQQIATQIADLHRWGAPTEEGSPLRAMERRIEARLLRVEQEADACRRVCRERGADLDSQRGVRAAGV